MSQISEHSKVAVLLASFNGEDFIAEQIHSILASQNVRVKIFLSDDGSSDATLRVARVAAGESLVVLPASKSGSAAQNFIRLMLDTDWKGFDYVSLSDQDDIWVPDKLERAISSIKTHHCAAYSSGVTAFWENGREKYLMKSHAQRKFDFAFEAAGPGNTYVFPTVEADHLRHSLLAMPRAELKKVFYHDWFFYAIFRSTGKLWYIDNFSGLRYRQHTSNVVGGSVGLKAKLSRFEEVVRGQFVDQAILTSKLVKSNYPIVTAIKSRRILDIIKFVPQIFEFRRKPSEALALFFLLLLRSIILRNQ